MRNYTATVIKTGNSYALRVPKKYVDENNLHQGQKVQVGIPIVDKVQDREKIQQIVKRLQGVVKRNKLAGQPGLAGIEDPASWQREIRKDRQLPFRSSD